MENNGMMLCVRNCSKSFPGVKALDDVCLDIRKGEVHALMGENGAGKSTIMKIIAGIHQMDQGEITFRGEKLTLKGPADALRSGISMIHQELNLIPDMTVEENLFIGREDQYPMFGVVKKNKLLEKAYQLFKELDIHIDPKQKVRELSVAEMQMVEIIKATSYNADVLIMDEPTSAITENEVEKLFSIINNLKKKDKAIIYISHKMDEIFKIADRVTVLRDGCFVSTDPIENLTYEKLISKMVGRELTNMFEKEEIHVTDEVVMDIENLTVKGLYSDISFQLKKGEILGLAGLMGAGRTEIVETIFGMRKPDSGTIRIKNQVVQINSPKKAIDLGIALVSEDRKKYGLNLKGSIKHNISLVYLDQFVTKLRMINEHREKNSVDEQMKSLRIKAKDKETITKNLSGGNQQKVVLSKWLLGEPEIIIMDEPTRGIDVGAKAEIYKIMTELTKRGKSIIMISSEMPELIGMSDRIVVLHEGKITGHFEKGQYNQESIMSCATGNLKEAL